MSNLKCDHCSDKVFYPVKLEVNVFCCHGCKAAHQIIKSNGLENYYELLSGEARPNRSLEKLSSFEYLNDPNFQKEFVKEVKGLKKVQFYIEGVHCQACYWIFSKLRGISPSVVATDLDMSSSILTIELADDYDLAKVCSLISSLGYKPRPLLVNEDQESFVLKENRDSLFRIGVSFACMGNIMLYAFAVYAGAPDIFKEYFNLLSFVCFIPIVFYAATPFYKKAFYDLLNKRLSVDIPIVFVIFLSFILALYSFAYDKDFFYLDSMSTLVFLLLSTRYLLKRITQSTLGRTGLKNLFSNKSATLLNSEDGTSKRVHTRFLEIGNKVLIKPGEEIPIDGIVVRGESYINNSVINGESKPSVVRSGDEVFMGAINLGKAIEILVSQLLPDTFLGRILSQVEQGSFKDTETSKLTDLLAKYFVWVMAVVSSSFFFYFLYFYGLELAIMRTVSLLIITCPCALAISAPLSLSLALSRVQSLGVMLKGEAIIEKLANLKNIYFDKTGTLTTGHLELKRIDISRFDEDAIDAFYSLETKASHPVARAIVRYFEFAANPKEVDLEGRSEVLGQGVYGYYENKKYSILSVESDTDELGHTVGFFIDEVLIVKTFLSDQVKLEAKEMLEGLSSLEINSFILSGDKENNVSNLAKILGLNKANTLSSLLPEDKRIQVSEQKNSCMVGDGVNDALALRSADLSIAVQGSASISLRVADIYLPNHDLSFILSLVKFSRKVLSIVRLNFCLSLAYNLVGVYLAFMGEVSPLVAAILMPISSLCIFFSSMSLVSYFSKKILIKKDDNYHLLFLKNELSY